MRKSEIELLEKQAKMFLQLRKELDLLIVVLAQTNDKMEDPRRLQVSSLHYPTKTDIHGSKQYYHAADGVVVIVRPELLNLDTYGPNSYSTASLIAFHIIKFRKGKPGLTRLREELDTGNIAVWNDMYNL